MKFYHRQRFEDSSSLLLSHQFSLLSTCTDVAQIPNFLIGDGSKTPNTKLCPPTTAIIAGRAFSIQRSWQADNAAVSRTEKGAFNRRCISPSSKIDSLIIISKELFMSPIVRIAYHKSPMKAMIR